MREFNLEEANNGAPVRTKGGYDVTILCVDKSVNPNRLIVSINYKRGEKIGRYWLNGKYFFSFNSTRDLMMKWKNRTYMSIKCDGRCLGEEETIPCPLRNNWKKFEEDVEQDDPLMFYTMAFGCDDYEPINEDIEWEISI